MTIRYSYNKYGVILHELKKLKENYSVTIYIKETPEEQDAARKRFHDRIELYREVMKIIRKAGKENIQ